MDPYKVLGINPNASDEEIKRAYRDMAKKYHPDRYVNNPLSDLAEEKLKEINEAYSVLSGKKSSSNGYHPKNENYYKNNSSTGGEFYAVRQKIQLGDIDGADSTLDQSSIRSAEWYFLKGVVFAKRGYYDNARQYFTTAQRMEPTNAEYNNALNSFANTQTTYQDFYGNRGGRMTVSPCSTCDMCNCLCCADTCCECMGGDLCTCC